MSVMCNFSVCFFKLVLSMPLEGQDVNKIPLTINGSLFQGHAGWVISIFWLSYKLKNIITFFVVNKSVSSISIELVFGNTPPNCWLIGWAYVAHHICLKWSTSQGFADTSVCHHRTDIMIGLQQFLASIWANTMAVSNISLCGLCCLSLYYLCLCRYLLRH